MNVTINHRELINDYRIEYTLRVIKPHQRIFGYLLDSAEGLATHSAGEDPDSMKVMVPVSQELDFKRFLEVIREV